MSATFPTPDLTRDHKLIVGEGPSDFKFFKAFCFANGISKFAHAFTGMHRDGYEPSGFDVFSNYLVVLERLAGFGKLTDLVLVCDSAESGQNRFDALSRQINQANGSIGRKVYEMPSSRNAISQQGMPRIHVLTVPHERNGGIETLCVDVVRDTLNGRGENGTEIEGWVNSFAGNACNGWTTEKCDKLRLQAFLSAAWQRKPEVHFSQLFDLTRDRFIPLKGEAFDFIREFLRAVEAL